MRSPLVDNGPRLHPESLLGFVQRRVSVSYACAILMDTCQWYS